MAWWKIPISSQFRVDNEASWISHAIVIRSKNVQKCSDIQYITTIKTLYLKISRI